MLSFLSQACYFLSKLRKSLYYALKPSHLRLLYPIFLFILSIIVVALLPWFSKGIYRVSSKDSIKDWSFFIKVWPSNQNVRVLGIFTIVSSIPMLVFQWWFCNKLVLEILFVFQNLKTKKLVSGYLILREMLSTFDKSQLRRLEVWTQEND
jgi:hypothetical protein